LAAGPAGAASFDFESVPFGDYAGSLVVSNSGLTLTVTPEGFPNGFVAVTNAGVPLLLGTRSVVGSQVSPINVDQFAPMRFTFSELISDITFAFGDSGGDDDSPWLIEAFDASNNLLASMTGLYPAGFGGGMTASLSMAGAGASYFLLSSTPAFNPHSLGWEVLDATVAAPEPGSLLLFCSGLGVVAAFARRRRR
jgi:hypothetical protein